MTTPPLDFIGVGAQKCATTWLWHVLSEHPQVFMIWGEREKDTRFFSEYYDRGYGWYDRHFEKVSPEKRIGEFSTSYFCSYDAAERVYNYNKQVKIFVCFRNPIDRALEQHQHQVRLGHVQGDDLNFENALLRNPTYVSQGLYYRYLLRWLQYFPLNQIHIVFLDDITKDSQQTTKNVYRFIAVDEEFIPGSLNKTINPAFVVKNSTVDKIKNKSVGLLRSLKLGFIVNGLKKMKVHEMYRNINSEEISSVVQPLSDDTRVKLYDYFSDDIKALSELTGRDLSHWK